MARRGNFKYTIDDMREMAEKRGGKCLSETFDGVNRYLEWECARLHVWRSKPDWIINGCWCRECANIEQTMTIGDMHKVAAVKGFKCMSETYINSYTHLRWQCKHGHIWSTTYSAISENSGCPYCAGRYRTIDFLISLAQKKNGKCLSTEFKRMGDKYTWECEKGHKWEARADKIMGGSWCPYCAGQAPITKTELEELAISRGGRLIDAPDKVCRRMKLLWECKHGHRWTAEVGDVKNKQTWYPKCKESKIEKECRRIFEEITGKEFVKTRKALGCGLELDGYCEELKLAFEYNGRQHYQHVEYWKNEVSKQKERDARKAKLCKQKGITLVVIPYTERKHLEEFIRNQLDYSCCSSSSG